MTNAVQSRFITVQLDARYLDLLVSSSAGADDLVDQADRFEGPGGHPVDLARFGGGTMNWCDTAGDAVLFESCQRALGHDTLVVVDLDDLESYVVVTNESWSTHLSNLPYFAALED